MKNLFTFLRSKGVKVASASAALVATSAVQAQTTLPPWVGEMATEADGTVTAVMGVVGPVIGAVLVALISIKLIKRFASKI